MPRWWTERMRAAEPAADVGVPTRRRVEVTCLRDGRDHQVEDLVLADRAYGQVVALCGRRVTVAALAAPPGPACPLCSAASALA